MPQDNLILSEGADHIQGNGTVIVVLRIGEAVVGQGVSELLAGHIQHFQNIVHILRQLIAGKAPAKALAAHFGVARLKGQHGHTDIVIGCVMQLIPGCPQHGQTGGHLHEHGVLCGGIVQDYLILNGLVQHLMDLLQGRIPVLLGDIAPVVGVHIHGIGNILRQQLVILPGFLSRCLIEGGEDIHLQRLGL